MRILVTGGAGFIGSHIVDRLIELGHTVFVVDNLSTGRRENVNPQAKFFQVDICSPQIEAVFQQKIDVVIHQAAQADVSMSIANPVHDATTNIVGTVNLLECCRKYNVQKIICAHSAAEIGNPNYLPLDERHALNPSSPYSISKHVMSSYLQLYQRLYGLKFTSLRYANVYGPRQNAEGEGGVIAIFARKLVQQEIPTIHGDGSATRDFVYVQDVVEANVLALTRGDNQLFHVGTGIETSIQGLVQEMIALSNSGIKPQYGSSRQGDIQKSVFNIQKIKKELGWEPKVSLKEGLHKTLSWMKHEI